MVKKRKRRGDAAAAATEAPAEVAEQVAPAAATADSATPGKTGRRRGGDAAAGQEASAAAQLPDPADSGKGTTDGEGKKTRVKKQKRSKTDQCPCPAASNADTAATGKSGDDCTDVVGVLGDAEVSMNPRNGDDPEVNIGEKGTPKRKKPDRKKGKKKKNVQLSSSAVSDDNAGDVDKSRTDHKDVEDVGGDVETIRSPRKEVDPGFSAEKIAEQEIPERKKIKKRKKNKPEHLPSAVTDGDTVVVGTAGNDCTHGKCVPGLADVSMSSRNGEDQDCPEVNIAEKETPGRKKPKLKKPKENKPDQSPSAVTGGDTVVVGTSGNDCTHGKGVPGVPDISTSSRNGEDQDCSEVNIAEKETLGRKKLKLKKPKENKQERSSAAVSDDGAAQLHKSENVCIDGDGSSGDAQVSMSTRNAADPYCPEVNIADEGTNERKKPKAKKRKNTKEGSSSVVLDAGDVVEDESRNVCKDGDGAPGDIEVTIGLRNGEDQDRPEVNTAEKEITGRKKTKLKKLKENKQERSSAAVSDDGAVQLHKSENVCIDGGDSSGDAQVSMGTRNAADPYCPVVNNADEGTNERKKPKAKKRKNTKEGSSSVALDAGDVVADESRNVCKDGDGAPRDIEATIGPRNGEDQDHPEVNTAEKEITGRKKAKLKKPKENKQERSSAAVSNDGAVQLHKSENVCIDGGDSSGDAQVSMGTRNAADAYCPVVNNADEGTNERKKPKAKKRKNTKEGSSSVALDAGDVVADDSRNVCKDGDGAPRDIEATIGPRNGEDQDRPEVNTAEKVITGRKKANLKKPKENKQERSSAAVSNDGAVQLHKSENVCIDGGDSSGNAQVTMSTRNAADPYCPVVNIADEGTTEKKKPKAKKRKNTKEGSSSVVLDAGDVVADESRNVCKDGDGAPRDIEATIGPRNGEDQDRPEVNNAENGIPEIDKPKRKKRKKNNKQQSPSAVLDADDVVMDKSGHDSTNVGAPSGGADVTISPRIGECPKHPKLNVTDDLLEGNKVNKDYSHSQKSNLNKKMKNKHEQSPSVVPDTCAAVEDKSGNSYVYVKGSLADAEISMSPRTGKDHDCLEVKIDNDFVDGNNGNNDSSQKPKNKIREKKRKAPVAVTEIPPVGVSSDEMKDVYTTGSMKVTAKSDIISVTSTSSRENHKENVRDIYSPEGSLVRFQRKKLLILDLNGILADINTDRNVAHMADGRVRGKNVFKRNYLDDFLRFCFQNFELGIWSSRLKVNVDAVVDIVMKDLRRHLVFCWDLSKCTTTNCNTLENKSKPLVLKELKKLWNKEDPDLPWEQGEFSPSNTLLVDDSPYKALRNPPNTAIFPQSYSYHMEEDESLGPGGDLRVYLENIAAADDVQRYVQEHPFGQPSITKSDPHWNFYAKIHYRMDRIEWSHKR